MGEKSNNILENRFSEFCSYSKILMPIMVGLFIV